MERLRIVYGGLVAHAEVVEARERRVRVAIRRQREGVEAAALQVEKLVAPDLADRAQLTPVAISVAQPCCATPIATGVSCARSARSGATSF